MADSDRHDFRKEADPLVRRYLLQNDGDWRYSDEAGDHGETGAATADGTRHARAHHSPEAYDDSGDLLADHTEQSPEHRPADTARVDLGFDDHATKGFLGSGWRSDPDEYEDEEPPRRSRTLLKVGGILVAAVGVIGALIVYVGQPEACADDCPADKVSSVTSPAASDAPEDAIADEDTEPEPDEEFPAEPEPTPEPTLTSPATTAPVVPRTERPVPSRDTTGRPSPESRPTTTQQGRTEPSRLQIDDAHTGDEQIEEPAEEPVEVPQDNEEDKSSGGGGGLFDWLFGRR